MGSENNSSDGLAKAVGLFVMVCIGLAVIIAAVALVSASLRPIPTPQIDVYIDRDGQPTVVPRPNMPNVNPYYPQPTPYRPYRPGSDTGNSKGESAPEIIDKKEAREKATYWRLARRTKVLWV